MFHPMFFIPKAFILNVMGKDLENECHSTCRIIQPVEQKQGEIMPTILTLKPQDHEVITKKTHENVGKKWYKKLEFDPEK